MKRFSRLISIILCVALLISCMVFSASASYSDDVLSYIYMDFVNVGWLAPSSYRDFTVHGLSSNTSGVVYLLCSRDAHVNLTGYASSGSFTITIDELWKNGSICCYRVKSNSAAAFNHDFALRVTNSHSDVAGAFNVYKVFSVAPSGIMNMDASGVTYSTGYVLPNMTPTVAKPISSFPFVYQSEVNENSNNRFFLDINIPISKFTGMQQGSFLAYANALNSTHLDLGSYLQSFTLLYNGAPIPFSYATSETSESIGGMLDFAGDTTAGVVRPLGNYLSVIFDIPQQLPAGEAYITVRFIYLCDATSFHFYFQKLFGRYSFVKTDYELTYDIYNILQSIEGDIDTVNSNLVSIKSVLHSDIQSVLAELQTTNSWLFEIYNISSIIDSTVNSIRNNLISLRNSCVNFFYDVGQWFLDSTRLIIESIGSWSQSIIDAINGDDAGAADEFKDSAGQQSNQISDGVGKIDAVEKPDLGDIDAEVNDYLDTSAVGLLAGTINIFFQFSPFYSAFSLVLLMMLASYVLFGKK